MNAAHGNGQNAQLRGHWAWLIELLMVLPMAHPPTATPWSQ